ncbi:MAG: PIN domain-containing protein [Acidobacteria bacterium]|nr:PIN domain-containing protein [Acidobacteriota bacterium]
MIRLLLDVSVVLDILLDRKPHVELASALFAAVEKGRGKAYLSAHGVTTVHYLIARNRGRRVAHRALHALLSVCDVAAVDSKVIRAALALEWNDFEDAVCAVAAAASRCDAIVTRDASGFKGSPVPAIDPGAALAWLGPG